MAPLLSIICPFYGVEAYLADCLDSLRSQTLTDFEVIMVDDGSPDNCRAIAESVAAIDERFTLVVQQNQGLGPARNTGVRHARGKYLAFVDSDDLVPPRGYELLVTTLERTGSDFAAGNARRFGGDLGPRQSWTHRNAFAATRLGTHISEFSSLIEDRMVWNKVYRRSFWDCQGYEFPPIRYEDYPVTLAAHLEATKVDVLSEHVYLWRERDSNDSITQMAGRVDNARDRVESAHLVLDLLTHDVDQTIVNLLHSYLIDVDLIALAGAVAKASPQDRPEVERLMRDLAVRLDLRASNTQKLARLVHSSAARGDFVMVEALARWRATGDSRALASSLIRHLPPSQWAEVKDALFTRRSKRRVSAAPKRLKAEVTQVTNEPEGFRISGVIKLRRQFTKLATVVVSLVGTNESATLPAMLQPQGNGYSLDVLVRHATITALAEEVQHRGGISHAPIDRCTLQMDVKLGPLRWQGPLQLPAECVPPIVNAGDGLWMQVSRQRDDDAAWIWTICDPVLITDIDVERNRALVGFSVPDGEFEVTLPEPSAPRRYPIENSRCSVDLAELIANDPVDDPVTKTATRELRVLRGGHRFRPFLVNDPASTVISDRVVSLDTSATGQAQLRYLPVEPAPAPIEEE